MASLFGSKKKNDEPKETENDTTEALKNEEEEKNMEWFDDVVDGSNSNKKNKEIMKKLWQEVTGANLVNRITSPSQRYAAKIWGKLCHRCNASYPPCDQLKEITDYNKTELKYAVRHAIASYPPSFIWFLGLKSDMSFAFKSNKKLLKSAFGIEPNDVIVDNTSIKMVIGGKTHQPHFYLAIDHSKKKIIISIRGSSSIADALTDVNGVCKEYSCHKIDGYVHEGMLASARFVFDKVTKPLISSCNEHKDYEVIITGHSLGAGVAALLGLMYADHPIICKQNKCKVWAFASPPIVSQSFVKVGLDFIISVAINTDLICRLSIESIKHQNLRLDEINKYPAEIIKECMVNLKDFDNQQKIKSETTNTNDGDNDEENEENPKYESLLTPFKLIETLKGIKTPNPNDALYPLGKILWFVPKVALEKDGIHRRRTLMGYEDESQKKPKKLYKHEKSNSMKDVLSQTWHNLTKGFEEFQETMDNSVLNSGGHKHALLFDGSHYALVDGTENRNIFQEFVLDLPEAMSAHFPSRYMWACDAHLTRGDLHYENEKNTKK